MSPTFPGADCEHWIHIIVRGLDWEGKETCSDSNTLICVLVTSIKSGHISPNHSHLKLNRSQMADVPALVIQLSNPRRILI